MRSTVHQTDELIAQLDGEINATVSSRIKQGNIVTLGASTLLLVVLIGVMFWLSGYIRRPIQQFSSVFTQAAQEHDLTLRTDIGGESEIGNMAKSFNRMMDEFQTLLQKVNDSTQAVATASSQVKQVTSATAKGVQQQQIESDQVSTAMNEMAATVQEVARNAMQAAETSTEAEQEAGSGAAVVAQSVNGVQSLADKIESVAVTIKDLEVESGNIGTVLSVINGIAEQTNLLALNAAIEAARAGEQGRGFAVVADEVRTLAKRSQSATEEIKTIIERLQNKSQQAVSAMDAGRGQVHISVEQSTQGGASLQSISGSVSHIRDMNTQIATASEEQSAVAEEINQSIVRIAQIAQQSAAGAEQMTETSSELAGLAEQLQTDIAQFKLGPVNSP
ncbi:MAG: methyl-accepting chemotaxis protein [Candidatus Thiodiazotropha weberae]|nr:methyl-accepting chemotaxis protein [Candidatus Thiodiazotropha lotti]MCG8013168.1 methyl-accepting chemotaxis protein [Candidatus Thiodiazotropha lotti]MCW4212641.1 methyl-accepting chemotaxis protein [Candidatus Thiodiazotropha lotti]MCW4216409.1 methyl-accepting chemotaxis protein [Candidatus Thiodiazotropha lotti]